MVHRKHPNKISKQKLGKNSAKNNDKSQIDILIYLEFLQTGKRKQYNL